MSAGACAKDDDIQQMQRDWYWVGEAAKEIGVSTVTMYTLRKEGRLLPDGKIGRRLYYNVGTVQRFKQRFTPYKRPLLRDEHGNTLYRPADAARYLGMSQGTFRYYEKYIVDAAHDAKGKPLYTKEQLDHLYSDRILPRRRSRKEKEQQ